MKELTTDVISALRFPLMLGVVLIHTSFGQTPVAEFNYIQDLFSVRLASPCVPLFFFFSGYLFFFKDKDTFSFRAYTDKLRRRTKSILVPFVFWNAVVIVYFAMLHKFVPSLINPQFNNVWHFSPMEWLRAFWDFPGGQPICYQFWFLRDLIIAFLIAPAFFYVIKKTKWYGVAILVTLYIIDGSIFPCQMMITFFCLGICFSIHRCDFVQVCRQLCPIALFLFVICLIISGVCTEGGRFAA